MNAEGRGMTRPLIEGVDFYMEGPLMVFTGKYLRERGWCCENGCRHCPWDYRRDRRSDEPGEEGTEEGEG